MHGVTRLTATGLLAGMLLAACAPAAPPLRELTLEPNYRFTYGGQLQAGDTLEIDADGLSETERLHLQRCGPDCETTEKIATWAAADFAGDKRATQAIEAAGEHYFWVEDIAKPKADSALEGSDAQQQGARSTVTFGGGVRVAIVTTAANGD